MLAGRSVPMWTDHNDIDASITPIELFAWVLEKLIYRLNRIPKRLGR
jgi:hypothetical protein